MIKRRHELYRIWFFIGQGSQCLFMCNACALGQRLLLTFLKILFRSRQNRILSFQQAFLVLGQGLLRVGQRVIATCVSGYDLRRGL